MPPHPHTSQPPPAVYPYPPAVYVPPPAPPPDPLAFDPEPGERPRRRRPEPRGVGVKGLVIALVVLAAVGLGWFGYVSLRAEWDKARLPEIRDAIVAENLALNRLIGRPPVDPDLLSPEMTWDADPDIRERKLKVADKYRQEYRTAKAAWDAAVVRPEVKARYDRIRALLAEHRQIARRHPEWQVPDPPPAW